MIKYITTYVHPPIPDRDFDWQAYLEDSDSEIVGYGRTENFAIENLIKLSEA